MPCHCSWSPRDTIFWFCCTLIKESAWIVSMSTIHSVDYDFIHYHMGHPSHDVLKQVFKNTQGFPSSILIPTDLPICWGCAQGKMHLSAFPNSQSHATSPFALIHLDLKELPVLSYHWYKFFITFLNNFTSYCWISLLRCIWCDWLLSCISQELISDCQGVYDRCQWWVQVPGITGQTKEARDNNQDEHFTYASAEWACRVSEQNPDRKGTGTMLYCLPSTKLVGILCRVCSSHL